MPVKARLAGLRQKTLFRIAVAYAVSAWLVIQVAATVAPAFEMSAWFLRAVILIALLGFIVTIGYFAFVRPERDETVGLWRRRNWLASLAAGGGLLLLLIVGAAYVARTTLFADEKVSLAVLPFADLSPQRDKAFLAEGVAEEILSALGKNTDLKVLGRSSSWALRDKVGDPAAIRASLGVTHLLEGSVRAAGPDLRLSVRLIRTADGSQEWTEDYRGRSEDVFALQDQVAVAVARRLSVGGSGSGTAKTETTSADAYSLYLTARQVARTRSEAELKRAYALARQVIDAKPDYAPGHALIAELIWLLSDDRGSYGRIPAEKARSLAVARAQTAIRLSPQSADGYGALGLVLKNRGGVEPLQRAVALDPARAELRIWLGVALGAHGSNDAAFEQYRSAAESEPLWPVSLNRLVQTLTATRRFDEADEAIQTFRQQGGPEPQVLRFKGIVAFARSDLSEAIKLHRAALKLDPTMPYVASWIARHYALLGMPNEALAVKHAREIYRFRRLWSAGDREGTRLLARSAPAEVMTAPDSEAAVFALGAMRDWPALATALNSHPGTLDRLCPSSGRALPQAIIALRETGQLGASRKLLDCMRGHVDREIGQTMRSTEDDPGQLEVRKASVLALAGDRSAIDWLEKAVGAGWLGQYYSSRLSDWPQFHLLLGDPRLAKLQQRIDATIARERAEAQRDLGQAAS